MSTVKYCHIEAARERVADAPIVGHTPVDRSKSLSRMSGGDVRLKMEHLQQTGSFKTRGAYNKLVQLAEDDGVEGVVAASAGNHAQGVALAASTVGLDATIVMPTNAPQTKVDATRSYGATVDLHGTDFREAMSYARTLAADDATAFVHAYDDPDIIAGQGTLGCELIEDVPDADTVVVPIGGGGLIAGVGVALAERAPDVRLVGVQAESAATVPQSLQKGSASSIESAETIADGIATGGISERTFELIEEHVDEIVTVGDDAIASAILLLLERAKQLVEGAGAASIAAILSDDLDVEGETVVPVLSGGNLDMSMLQTVLTYALTERQQLLRLRVRITDEPGQMHELSGVIAEHDANIRTVRHDRSVDGLDVGEAYLVFEVETSGTGHARAIKDAIADHGYSVEQTN